MVLERAIKSYGDGMENVKGRNPILPENPPACRHLRCPLV